MSTCRRSIVTAVKWGRVRCRTMFAKSLYSSVILLGKIINTLSKMFNIVVG